MKISIDANEWHFLMPSFIFELFVRLTYDVISFAKGKANIQDLPYFQREIISKKFFFN